MDENDLKRYTVILDDGSGVLFQPLDETKTYILSARHVFYEDVLHDDGPNTSELKSTINYSFSDNQNQKNEVEIIKDSNYFEHDIVDAAILVLDVNLNLNEIFVDDRTTGLEGFNLTGYPESKRKSNNQYDKQLISDLINYDDNLIELRLVVNHLDHEQITGFSGGGIIKTNGDSLLLAGIQSKTPNGPCNGEINVVRIKRFEEIVDKNNLSKLLPSYLANINPLVETIIDFKDTIPNLRPKLKKAISVQLSKIKCDLKDIYNNNIINKSSISNTSKKSKSFWTSFIEYALIISLVEDSIFDENLLYRVSEEKKFFFSDSSKDFYSMYDEILLNASDDVKENCQLLVGTSIVPGNSKTRRRPTNKVPLNISNPDDLETIDRIIKRNKIKEIIHLKAIELDCINNNDELLDSFELIQFEEILTEIKRLVHEFFNS